LRDAPTGLKFNNCALCPHCIYLFSIYLRTNKDLCHLQHKLIGFYLLLILQSFDWLAAFHLELLQARKLQIFGFYNRDEKCLLRGTNWVFK